MTKPIYCYPANKKKKKHTWRKPEIKWTKRNLLNTQPNVKQNRHHNSYLSEGCLVSLLRYKQWHLYQAFFHFHLTAWEEEGARLQHQQLKADHQITLVSIQEGLISSLYCFLLPHKESTCCPPQVWFLTPLKSRHIAGVLDVANCWPWKASKSKRLHKRNYKCNDTHTSFYRKRVYINCLQKLYIQMSHSIET